jgi:hypothetical protein
METKCDFMVNRAILIEMGFKPSQAARMIKESKAYLARIEGIDFYNNRQVGVVPSRVIEHLFTFKLRNKQYKRGTIKVAFLKYREEWNDAKN